MKLYIGLDKQDVFVQSIMWNSIIEVFKNEKNIDITSYLISVQLRSTTILVKVTKPIIRTEALILDDKIKKVFQEKLEKLGLRHVIYDIKYI